MLDHTNRIGNFTSSNAFRAVTKGSRKMTLDELRDWRDFKPKSKISTTKDGFDAKGLTYIEEKQIERRMGRSLDVNAHSQSIAWGSFMELVLFNVLGLEYKLVSKEPLLHPEYGEFWAGTPDLRTLDSIAEVKCYYPKKFAQYTDCILSKNIFALRKDFPQEYWQIVSNACIVGVEYGEAITYMPYASEMEGIRDLAENYDGDDQWKYRFIVETPNSHLPVLPDGKYYKNVNKFKFKIFKSDLKYLTNRMIEANKML